MSKQHDELESPAAMKKRLGITAKTRKAARKYASRVPVSVIGRTLIAVDFLAGAAWERRRRAKDGY